VWYVRGLPASSDPHAIESRFTTFSRDYERYLRVIQSTREANPSPSIRSLVGAVAPAATRAAKIQASIVSPIG